MVIILAVAPQLESATANAARSAAEVAAAAARVQRQITQAFMHTKNKELFPN